MISASEGSVPQLAMAAITVQGTDVLGTPDGGPRSELKRLGEAATAYPFPPSGFRDWDRPDGSKYGRQADQTGPRKVGIRRHDALRYDRVHLHLPENDSRLGDEVLNFNYLIRFHITDFDGALTRFNQLQAGFSSAN